MEPVRAVWPQPRRSFKATRDGRALRDPGVQVEGTLLIVEGPDRVGKDTLIRNLTRGYADEQWVHVHNPAPPPDTDALAWCKRRFVHQAVAFGDLSRDAWNIAINRFHLSEYVYALAYRDYDPGEIIGNVEFQLPLDTALVVLTDDPGTLHKRRDDESTIGDTRRICALYDAAWHEKTDLKRRLLMHVGGLAPFAVQRTVHSWLEATAQQSNYTPRVIEEGEAQPWQ